MKTPSRTPPLCGKCGRLRGENGHDPCISNTPGVVNACCGHGDSGSAYFMFAFGPTVRGSQHSALTAIRLLGGCRKNCAGFAVAQSKPHGSDEPCVRETQGVDLA